MYNHIEKVHTLTVQFSDFGHFYLLCAFRPIVMIFRRGVTTWVYDVYVCMHKHARIGAQGACSPRNFFFFEIRYSEIDCF